MAYQSIKRVLGETSLERKCRLLFGTCLLLLIAGAFIWVDQIAESLVKDNQTQAVRTWRQRSRGLAQMRLLAMHFEFWAEDNSEGALADDPDPTLEVQQLANELIDQDEAAWEIMTLKRDHPSEARGEERRVLELLLDDLRNWERREREALALGEEFGEETPFRESRAPGSREYVFYQPVIWQPFCTNFCHPTLSQLASTPETSTGLPPADTERLFAVKITMETPYQESQAAIHWIRAILSAAGITTFFVAMVALYVIVRYVIVKPLSHLRDVSEAIFRSGNTELRAEIHTNDEFEDLAHSFNRMLRHLTETQADLRHVNHDLDAKVDELAQLNMRLYEMNRLKSDFLANMSHELRTPLNSIIGFSEVLQGIQSLSDKQKRYARNIQKSGRVLLDMINDILDLAKIDAGKMDLRLVEFQIDVLVHIQCDIVRALSEEKNIDLTESVPSDLPPLFQDQSKVQQILTNLLSNAIKFTPEGGRVDVRAERDSSGRLVLIVADSGVGIPEEDREVIFEKFRQSKSVSGKDGLTREFSGTGLGLSIVKELCILLHGEISFESQLGQGSTFRVVLPWALDESPPDRFDYGRSSGFSPPSPLDRPTPSPNP